jgi:hypothetical protein
VNKILWPNKQELVRRREPNGSQLDIGLTWFEWSRFIRRRHNARFLLPFAFVATHNHFVLDRGGKVFKQSSPVIKLPEGASEDRHLELLGLLNSSAACFWLKQVSHDKGSQGINEGIKSQAWERFYEFTSTQLARFPLPGALPLEYGRTLDGLAQQLAKLRPSGGLTREELDAAGAEYETVRRLMVFWQEELDWWVYRAYGLLDADDASFLTPGGAEAEVALGGRAFEIAVARRVANGEETTEWFARHGSTPRTTAPNAVVQRRLDLIAERRDIALLERPEYKRRWAAPTWEEQERKALTRWLLDRLENKEYWFDSDGHPRTLTVNRLADLVSAQDAEFRRVVSILVGRPDFDLATEIEGLVEAEHVPYLAAHRYTAKGLAKRKQWERTWDLQRQEDAGEPVGMIAVPPRYQQADFRRTKYWRLRGKLDVPKERFISYRDAGKGVLGWAGWDHLQQMLALATLYLNSRTEQGWTTEQLTPLLAGQVELEPWVRQWHGEDPDARFVLGFLDTELASHGLTREDIA